MYRLYTFNPQTVMTEGYLHRGEFASEQDCNDFAFENNFAFYRIELISFWGCLLIFETPWETVAS